MGCDGGFQQKKSTQTGLFIEPTETISSKLMRSRCVKLTWQSVNTRTYFLERGTNLAGQPPFSAIVSNIAGQTGTASYTDTNAAGPGPFFYRVGIQ